ncbi:putative protein, contains DTW domain [Handroanthus impetiginosus]|uniref:tRNA-uridine aminocarboxypropyltransferase n=1 Tax=Handroanthus impetiginosus TaxID=429701 RepID=A0A2G9H3W6_9LAMI|nr:putative protein, contains DTW domain [Handroanthus impetiginosus]
MLRARIELPKGNSPFSFCPSLNPLRSKIPKLPDTQTLISRMVTNAGYSKRPTCPSCSKPTRICLCNRLRTPTLQNSVTVTILQHSLEKKHPLNSTRIATIGLKHVDVVTVSDVNFQARFFIRLLDSNVKLDEGSHLFDEMPSERENYEFVGRAILGDSDSGARGSDLDGQVMERSDFNGAEKPQICKNDRKSGSLIDEGLNSEVESGCEEVAPRSCSSYEAMLAERGEVIIAKESTDRCLGRKEAFLRGCETTAFNFTIGKYGAITSFNNCWTAPEKHGEMSLDRLLASHIAALDIRKGFVVKKLGTKLLEGSNEYEESEEFEIAVPPGSVLLFPSERSVDVTAVNFEVKNLIVLDGTWAKAKRMYNENPWLRLLPHIRLDLDKLSLYSEVRHQPRAGYLSTIESIVYAMKALEEDSEGLDGLLDVFESMVGDQRRCKNERLSKASEKIE